MSEKPKKTLSPEQLEKMRLGRKRAYEKRKAEREAAKAKSKEVGEAKKKNDKEKLLQLEMEAMQQQQDRIDNLRLQVERKKEVKSKLKAAKLEPVQEEPEPEEPDEPEHVEEVIEEVAEDIEEVVEKVEKKLEKKSEVSDAEYTQVFYREAGKMKKNIPKEVQHYYDDAISKFDFTLSLDDNIKNMIDYVEQVVIKNSKVINDVRDVQKKVEEKQEVVSKLKQEDEAEKHIDSQISRLMKMRY
jgi:DNA-binding ferritin-like protein